MRISAVAFFMILTTVFLSGCSSQKQVAVEDRGGNFYGRNGMMALANASGGGTTSAAVSAAPVTPVAVAEAKPAASNEVMTRKLASAPENKPIETASGTWQWPVNGKVIENYGHKADGVVNEGIVISAAEGTPIKAAQAGEVAFVGNDTKNYGNIVILRHANGDMTSYAHARTIIVTKGERVASGATIGFVGRSGNAKAPQLHFAVREGKTSVDPLSKLPHTLAMN